MKSKRKKGCLISFGLLFLLVGGCRLLDAYQNRPSALYERWIGGQVPDDVEDLEGQFHFALTESVCWLDFVCPQDRINQIVEEKGMLRVTTPNGWSNRSEDDRAIFVGEHKQYTNWFDFLVRRSEPKTENLQLYWRGHSIPSETDSGWALCYTPEDGRAFWTSISY